MLRIGDRYRVIGVLGRGASGEVLRARDEVIGRDVAIKVLHLSDSAARDAALREARALAKIAHENVVKVFDVGETTERAFIVMELVEGRTLRQVIASGENVPRSVRLGWLIQLASGLAAVHARGVVHGDVKPENVVIAESGRLTLIDFGLVKATRASVDRGAITRTLESGLLSLGHTAGEQTVLGTPEYMAPEQLRGEPLDGRADQFAWGVIAFELLIGTRPWGSIAFHDAGALAKVLGEDAPILSRIDSTIPGAISDVVARALQRRAVDRFVSSDELTRALTLAIPPMARRVAVRAYGLRKWSLAITGGWAILLTLLLAQDSPQPEPQPNPLSMARTASRVSSAAEHHFMAGRQAQRDASKFAALNEFELAQSLDPTMAKADLWWVICMGYVDDVAEMHFRRAFALRGSLEPLDLELLIALEPRMRRPVDVAESNRRLAFVALEHPRSSDAQFVAGKFSFLSGERDQAITFLNAALSLDPRYADAYRLRAAAKLIAGKTMDALRDLETCLEAAPTADTCIQHQYELYANEGRCEDAERMVRTLIAHDPSNPSWGLLLITAHYGSQGSVQETRTILDAWRLQNFGTRPLDYFRRAAHLAILEGDLELAGRISLEWEAATENSFRLDDHVFPNRFRQWLSLERGDKERAGRIARDFLVQSTAWALPTNDFDPRIYSIETLSISGTWTRAVARREASKWLDAELTRPGAERGIGWVWGFAGIARDKSDALYALDALPNYQPMPDPLTRRSNYDELIGLMFLKAERPTDSLPFLRRAARACRAVDFPFAEIHARWELALALRATGDRAGACRELEAIEPWARRARSAITGRAVLSALAGCPARD